MRSASTASTAAKRLRSEQARVNRNKHEIVLLRQIRYAGLPKPEREYRFAALSVGWRPGQRQPKGEPGLRERLAQGGVTGLSDWRFDFAWPEQMVALEAEGGVWKGGRHQTPQGFAEDCRKYREATALGWRVFRFTGEEVQRGGAIDFLRRWFGFA